MSVCVLALFSISACMTIRQKDRGQEIITAAPPQFALPKAAVKPVSSLPPEFRLDLRFQSAELAEKKGDWQKALKEYKEIFHLYRTSNERASTYALFRTSFCYEAQGEDVKAISSLLDSYGRKEFLPVEIGKAEIPSRLGFIYLRLGYDDLGNKYFDRATKGLIELKGDQQNAVDPSWIVSTLIRMGTINLNQISEENFKRLSETFMRSQNFIAEAIEIDSGNGANEALLALQDHYMKFWNFMSGLQAKSGVDSQIARYDLNSRQNKMADLILENILALKARWLVFSETEDSAKYAGLKTFADTMEKECENFIADHAEKTPLTYEAQNLQSLRKEFKVLDVKPMPEVKIPELTQPPPDPNL